MTDSPFPPEPRAIPAIASSNPRRRRWLIAGVVGLLFATIFAVIVYSDAPEPDTSDLAPRRIHGPLNLRRRFAGRRLAQAADLLRQFLLDGRQAPSLCFQVLVDARPLRLQDAGQGRGICFVGGGGG